MLVFSMFEARLFVVEDELNICELFLMLLWFVGFEVYIVGDG